MSVISRSALESSPLADLHEIASELGMDGYRRLRKADLVAAIIDRQGANGDEPSAEAEVEVEVEPEPDAVRSAIALTIDITGEPGVPFVSALAPMPPTRTPVAPRNPRAAAKARGLRRLIAALRRG